MVSGEWLCPVEISASSWPCAGKWRLCWPAFAARRTDGVEFYELEDAVVAVGGIGREAASRAAEALVARYSPSVLVSAGIAGALTPKLKVGDVVRAREVVDADSGDALRHARRRQQRSLPFRR